ncbi:LOW QUALITY PROTEIN: BLM-like protein, partial [Mya arenaria]
MWCTYELITRGRVEQEYSKALETFNKVYKTEIPGLKPLQAKTLNVLLSGKDCVCCLPTGYGKSLIFEILPFIDPACLVLVVEPLNVIMVQECQKLGDSAICLSAESDLGPVKDGKVKYIFCHPEDILNNKSIIELFRCEHMNERKTFLVIDEAHCVLEWGDDFRPNYKQLANLRSVFVCNVSFSNDCECVCAPPTKANIELIVLKRPSATARGNCASTPYDYIFERVLHELNDLGSQFPITVIYCKSMQWIGYGYQLAREILNNKFYVCDQIPENARVVMFHSSMEGSIASGLFTPKFKVIVIIFDTFCLQLKQMILDSLQKPPEHCSIRLVFASVALGMGADLQHVKRVIHAGPPSSLETYVQEIGRCGRDGAHANAILYYNNSDLGIQHMQASMKDYCKTDKCKREFINEHFGFDLSDRPTICCNICQSDLVLKCPDIVSIVDNNPEWLKYDEKYAMHWWIGSQEGKHGGPGKGGQHSGTMKSTNKSKDTLNWLLEYATTAQAVIDKGLNPGLPAHHAGTPPTELP